MFASRLAVDTALSFSRTCSSGSDISDNLVSVDSWVRIFPRGKETSYTLILLSIFSTFSSSLSVTKLTATPPFPFRAVLPTRWVYSSGSDGTSQLITKATSSISKPREPTSVDISTGTTDDRNNDSELSRSRWGKREWSAVLLIPRALSKYVRYAADLARAQNMIVGGGWAISGPDVVEPPFLSPFAADFFGLFGVGSWGALRRWTTDSGG